MIVLLLLAACSCGPRGPTAGTITTALIESPYDGVTLGTNVPLMLRLPVGWEDAEVHTFLDDAPADDPLGLLRRRWKDQGDGVDYLAWLDLVAAAPGPHVLRLVATRGGERQEATSRFTWAPPECRVDITLTDATGPVPGKVVVYDAAGDPIELAGPDAHAADPMGRDVSIHTLFAPQGLVTAFLPCGTYTMYAARGPRHAVDVQEVRLDAPRNQLSFALPRVVDTPDQVTADLHVHTGRSADSFIPDRLRWDSVLASDIDIIVITDHNLVADFAHSLAHVAGEGASPVPVTGTEGRIAPASGKGSVGHFNAFPVDSGVDLPDAVQPTVAAHIDNYRAIGPDVVLQLNHPRGIQFFVDRKPVRKAHALFNQRGFDPTLELSEQPEAFSTPRPGSGTTGLDWDAIELVNRFSWPLYQRVRRDWFYLLNRGLTPTGTGNSDSHAAEVEIAGFPLNLVRCPPPGTPACLTRAIRSGQVTVTTGPIVDLTIIADRSASAPPEGVETRIGPGGLATVGAGPIARVRVRAAAWVPVTEVRLVVGGEILHRASIPSQAGILDQTWEWPVAVSADTWILAEAGWPIDANGPVDPIAELGTYARVAPGHVPLGFTNPVRIDANGDGRWVPRP